MLDAAYPQCVECDALVLPTITMRVAEAHQAGVYDSYCVEWQAGQCANCAELKKPIESFLSTAPGSLISFSFDNGTARLVAGAGCSPACPPTLHIERSDDGATTETRVLSDAATWTVDVAPGTYEVWLDAHFEDGTSEGRMRVGFGLTVESEPPP